MRSLVVNDDGHAALLEPGAEDDHAPSPSAQEDGKVAGHGDNRFTSDQRSAAATAPSIGDRIPTDLLERLTRCVYYKSHSPLAASDGMFKSSRTVIRRWRRVADIVAGMSLSRG